MLGLLGLRIFEACAADAERVAEILHKSVLAYPPAAAISQLFAGVAGRTGPGRDDSYEPGLRRRSHGAGSRLASHADEHGAGDRLRTQARHLTSARFRHWDQGSAEPCVHLTQDGPGQAVEDAKRSATCSTAHFALKSPACRPEHGRKFGPIRGRTRPPHRMARMRGVRYLRREGGPTLTCCQATLITPFEATRRVTQSSRRGRRLSTSRDTQ
jgi:hypothetical protein